jgi:hypothetical protein
MVRRTDLDADHDPARARVQGRAERPDGLRGTQEAPPCRRPKGWVLPSTGIVATTCVADADWILTPIRPASVPSATVIVMARSSSS